MDSPRARTFQKAPQTAPGRLAGYSKVDRPSSPPELARPSVQAVAPSPARPASGYVKAEYAEPSVVTSNEWPWCHPTGLVLYFDPFSADAKKLADKLEVSSTSLARASHLMDIPLSCAPG